MDDIKILNIFERKKKHFQSDDMKKEAAKMMKKINEVVERSENLESQVTLRHC